MSLDSLICDLEEDRLKCPNKKMMLEALTSLKDTVGNDRLKNDIAKQVILFLKKGKHKHEMINICLCGPPGVGKSTISNILAKIIGSLEILYNPQRDEDRRMREQPFSVDYVAVGTVFYFSYVVLSIVLGSFLTSYSQLASLGLSTAIVIILIAMKSSFVSGDGLRASHSGMSKPRKSDGNMISATREDIVAEYVGQTAIKTSRFLAANRGKVILWDEAYSLISGTSYTDGFGDEALKVINTNMSEHPEDNVHIFAGYKDKMLKTIFRVQPGLLRRCIWTFEMDGYTPEELSKIFEGQLSKDLKRDFTEEELTSLIKKNVNLFQNYGGDTERLAHYARLESVDTDVVDMKILEQCVQKLRENYLENDKTNSGSIIDNIAKSFM